MSELAILVIVIIGLFVFKSTIKKVSKTTDHMVTNVLNEIEMDSIKESNEQYEAFVEEVGDDFITPDELYKKLQKRKVRMAKKSNN